MIRRVVISDRERDYLVVNRFLKRALPARALRTSLDVGLIDRLGQLGTATTVGIAARLPLNVGATDFLLSSLAAGQIVEHLPDRDDDWQLAPTFRRALKFRDLLEARLDLALAVWESNAGSYDRLLTDQDIFRQGTLLSSFRTICTRADAARNNENALDWQQFWFRYSTAVTRYESQPCLALLPLQRHEQILDVAGSNAEFAVQACRHHPRMVATLLDDANACRMARDHVIGCDAAAARVRFLEADLQQDALPLGHDAVCFRSVLNNWPDEFATRLLEESICSLPKGGRVFVYEHAPVPVGELWSEFHLLPTLLRSRSFRPPDYYVRAMRRHACDVEVHWIQLELPFYVVTGTKLS